MKAPSGRRISRRAYEQAVTALAGRDQRQEFDFLINYRLGIDFPTDRRDDLWDWVRRPSIVRFVAGLLAPIVGGERMLPIIMWTTQHKLRRILTPDELKQFLAE